MLEPDGAGGVVSAVLAAGGVGPGSAGPAGSRRAVGDSAGVGAASAGVGGAAAAGRATAAGSGAPPAGGVAGRAGPKARLRTSRCAIVRSRTCTSITRPLGVMPLMTPTSFCPVVSSTTSAAAGGDQAAQTTTASATPRRVRLRPGRLGLMSGGGGGRPRGSDVAGPSERARHEGPGPRRCRRTGRPTRGRASTAPGRSRRRTPAVPAAARDRKSTRLNSSHVKISYAVFCLKKKKKRPTLNAQHLVIPNTLHGQLLPRAL